VLFSSSPIIDVILSFVTLFFAFSISIFDIARVFFYAISCHDADDDIEKMARYDFAQRDMLIMRVYAD